MNLPAINKVQLPAHLQHLQGNSQLMSVNSAAAAGLSLGGWPTISIRGARFHLTSPQGEEVHVNELFLDVVVVDANPHPSPSKRYYVGKYDPNGEGVAPDCYSDNGIGPSSKAARPQSSSCATCPHNTWGSKISEASGKAIKACTDLKKVAVLIAANTSGPVMELDIPAASLQGWAQYIQSLDKHGIPAAAIVTRLTFDPQASFPKLMFAPAVVNDQLAYISAEQAADVMEVIGTEEVDQCTGKNDKAMDPSRAITVATPAPVVPMPIGGSATPGFQAPINMPTRLQNFPAQNTGAANPSVAASAPSLPSDESKTPQVAVAAPVTGGKRTRRSKPPEAGTAFAAPSGVAAGAIDQGAAAGGPLPAFIRRGVPAQPQSAQDLTVLNPQVTNASLDDMIKKAMAV